MSTRTTPDMSDRRMQFLKDVCSVPEGRPRTAVELYNALLTIVRQNAQGHPHGHDAIVKARAVLARATQPGRVARSIGRRSARYDERHPTNPAPYSIFV
jgi:hypothetical protein